LPANLPPEAKAKLAKYSDAKTVEEKIRALEEFISAVPKHKGTENLLLWARRRLAELREELEAQRRRRRGGGGPRIFIERAGAGQVVMLGPPNAGKSSLLARLTNARVEVAPYPFTTRLPAPGMLAYEDVQIQLVDTPPLLLDQPESPVNNRVLGLARNANALMLVVGLDDPDPAGTLERLLRLLEDRGILVTRSRGMVRIRKDRSAGGIKVVGRGRLVGFTEDDLRRLLAEYRVYNAVVEIEGDVTLEDVEDALFTTRVYKPTLIVLNKADLPGAARGRKHSPPRRTRNSRERRHRQGPRRHRQTTLQHAGSHPRLHQAAQQGKGPRPPHTMEGRHRNGRRPENPQGPRQEVQVRPRMGPERQVPRPAGRRRPRPSRRRHGGDTRTLAHRRPPDRRGP